jgi:hypothetical protein
MPEFQKRLDLTNFPKFTRAEQRPDWKYLVRRACYAAGLHETYLQDRPNIIAG